MDKRAKRPREVEVADRSDSDSDVEFSGITQPTLLQQIKTILDEYRNDVQIIKELVQNADDAEASEMGILYQGERPEDQHLDGLKYGKFLQAPALIVYNDAEFNAADWEGIKAIYSSVKKDDPLKIGRFGLGFKSVFHMTDNPCIISGENALFIDPHEKLPDRVCSNVKLKTWHKPKYRAYVDVLQGMFGFSEETVRTGRYRGTLFCFSLRKIPSELSENTYAEQEVWNLLQAFISESNKSLLFLKTLCSVKIYVDLADCVPRPKRRKLKQYGESVHLADLERMSFGKDTECYSVKITNDANDLIGQKQKCLQELKEIGHAVPHKSKYWAFNLIIETERKSKSEEVKEARARWFVLNYLKGGDISERTKELLEDKELRYLHLVGLAAPIHDNRRYKNDTGQVFCYQPLPHDTGAMTKLPVHLNAFFALSQNRRQVRWPDEDEVSHNLSDKKIEWNIALVTEMFPEAYRKLVAELVQLSIQKGNPKHFIEAVHNTIPTLEYMTDQWRDLAGKYISLSKCDNILYTEQENGKWISPQTAIFADFSRFQEKYGSIVRNSCQQTLIKLLLKDKVNVLVVTEHVTKSLATKHPDLVYITPAFVKKHLNAFTTYKTLTQEEKEDLLEIVYLDSSDESLEVLELLPLADDTFVQLSGHEKYFFEDQKVIDLFPGKEGKFVSTNIRPRSKEILAKLADSRKYSVTQLTDVAVMEFLKEILCNKADEEMVIQEQITEVDNWKPWIEDIWNLLQERFRVSLQMFVGLPLFPVINDFQWIEASKFRLVPMESPLLHIPLLRNVEDKEHVYKSFDLMRVSITNSVPSWLDNNSIHAFLPDDTSEGLISLFARVSNKGIENFNTNSTDAEAAAILKYLSERIHSDVDACKEIFLKLKLFRGYTSANVYCRVSLNECFRLYSDNYFPVPFPYPVIAVKTENEMSFAKRLGMRCLSEKEIVLDTLKSIDRIEPKERHTLIRWIINEGTHFSDDTVQELMTKVNFLKGGDRKWHMPCELFDPTDKDLCDLFQNAAIFPLLDSKTELKFIEGLQQLGLKSKTHLTSIDIQNICKDVNSEYITTMDINQKQCRALLTIMDTNQSLIEKDNIVKLKCIMIEESKYEYYPDSMPLKNRINTTACLCLPSEVKSSEYIDLVGSVFYTIKYETLPGLCGVFDWQTEPTIHDVLTHLTNVVRAFKYQDISTCLPMIVKIYKWLALQYEFGIENLGETVKGKFVALDNKSVWVGDSFQASKHVYIENTEDDIEDMRPFIYKLPNELNSFAKFFIEIGCRPTLKLDMYLETLARIKDESEKLQMCLSHIKLRKMAVSILNKLSKDFADELAKIEQERHIFFPVVHEDMETLKMKPTKQCTFCDAQWLKDMELETDDDIFYVHADVPIETAETLGVPSLRQQMLSNSEAFEEWGQEEPLTRRIRNLLKDGYVDGFSVAKELFQNADDAGASELCILFDERENNDTKTQLISDGMAEWQGPAIWAYNDAKFTEQDFKNITKLSGGTKLMDSTKIGKFGLGFCAVYNITDVPSFVSGDNAVIFDPHTTFLGKALPGKSPGLRIDFSKMKNLKMMKRLKNQFKPFDQVFTCRLTDCTSPSIDGTLFRLPLRNKASDISDTVYTTSEVKMLLQKTMAMAANMLLFNQNVKKFQIFHLPKSEKDPLALNLLYKVDRQNTRLMPGTEFSGPILREVSCRKEGKELAQKPLLFIEKVNIAVHVTSDLHYKSKTPTESVSTWIVSWATGMSEKSLQLTYNESGAINIGAVAVPVTQQSTGDGNNGYLKLDGMTELPDGYYKKGHLFFFLPLPIEHNFAFHINSQFAVTADRRRLQVSSEEDKYSNAKEWNESLFMDPIPRAFLLLLENLKNIGPLHQYVYSQLWPKNEADQTLQRFQRSFYRSITSSEVHNVFEKNGHWFDISRCVFLDRRLRKSRVGDTVVEVLSLLTDFVMDIEDEIYSLMLNANQHLVSEKTVSEEQFFLEYFLPSLEHLETDEYLVEKRDRLIRYAISIDSSCVKESLKLTECIPCQPHGRLHRPRDLIDPTSKLANLYCISEERFPMNEFAEIHSLELLRGLGMIREVLPDEMVIDRAQSIETLHKKCCFCSGQRAGCLLVYLSEKWTSHDAILLDLQSIAFFPVKRKPSNWRFGWFAENNHRNKSTGVCDSHPSSCLEIPHVNGFATARNIFHSNSKNIVGCVAQVLDKEIITRFDRALTDEKQDRFMSAVGVDGINTKDVDTGTVIAQLEAIAHYKPQSSNTTSKVLYDVYQYLEYACTIPTKSVKIEQLKTKQIVHINRTSTFVYSKQVAKKLYSSCAPLLFKLEDSIMSNFPKLSNCLGIVDDFAPFNFAVLMQQMKQQRGDKMLDQSEIGTAINILTSFVQGIKPGDNVDDIIGEPIEAIFGPDEDGILRDCRTMCFNDFDAIEKSETMIYIHEDVPPSLAKRLGVKPKVIQNLDENSEDIEDFYQEEPLVTRLQRLVEGYPCDSGIFKELLQNADDAKANEIVFLKDYTSHPINNVIHQSFQPLQGPALCVFNDSAFSNEDLKGIQLLGRGSKSNDPSKTGRYGVGFNAVYNLTDAPSFYTKGSEVENGETICFFDPLAKYIPSVTRQRPGKRYKKLAVIKRYHNDMMSGYHAKQFLSREKGTVFRFPLRTSTMAHTSDIKKESIDMDIISKLLESFSEELGEIMLFLKNLKKVKVLTYTEMGYEVDYSVCIQMIDEHQRIKDNLTLYTKSLHEEMKMNRNTLLQYEQKSFAYEITSTTEQRGKRVKEDKFVVVQTVGFKDGKFSEIPVLKCAIMEGNISFSPHGGVAFNARNDEYSPNSFHCDHNRPCKAFCFLPLPIETGLPVHVHGNFFLDHESRRSLWKAEKTESCYRTLWNNALIKLVITPAYVALLEYIKAKMFIDITGKEHPFMSVSCTVANYQSLFPTIDKSADYYWKHLTCCVYNDLVEDRVSFLPIQNVTIKEYEYKTTVLFWTPLNVLGCSFPTYIMKESHGSSNAESNFNNILRRIGMKIAFVKDEIKHTMKVANVEVFPVSPKTLIEFVCSFDSPMVDTCRIETGEVLRKTVLKSLGDTEQILKFCLEDNEYLLSRIHQIPLMVTQDNIVRTVSETKFLYIEPTGRYCNFFPTKRYIFLKGSVADLLHQNFKGKIFELPSFRSFKLPQFLEIVRETGIIQESDIFKVWDRKSPDEHWIKTFWDFFRYLLRQRSRYHVIEEMQTFKVLPLIPAIESDSKTSFLVPPCDINRLIYLPSFGHAMYEVLSILNIPQIDSKAIGAEILNDVVPNYRHPASVVDCLYFNKEKLQTVHMTCKGAAVLLRFFNDNLAWSFVGSDIKEKLRNLPIFESRFDQLVSLSSNGDTVVLDGDIPNDGLRDLAERANVLLLKDTGFESLFKGLGITCLHWADVYENFIVPNQDQLTRLAFYKHIEYLSDKLPWVTQFRPSLLSKLANVAFIETNNQRLVKACELFDPSHPVFGSMCGESEIVPKFLREKNVLKLLRRLGLKCNMTVQLFEAFAKEIEGMESGHTSTESISKTSKLLVSHLLQMDEKFFRNENFEKLRNIKFIKPFIVDANLATIHPQFNRMQLICFERSVMVASEHVCWTVANILSEEADPGKQNTVCKDILIEKLGISKEIDLQRLTAHCVNIGRSLDIRLSSRQEVCHQTATAVISSLYTILDDYRKRGALTTEATSQLKTVPFVYYTEPNTIRQTDRVVNVCKEDEEIPPYFSKCPSKFAQFQDLFLALGARKEPSCEAYVSVLNAIKSQSGPTQQLLPKEISDSMKAMENFFKYLIQQPTEIDVLDENIYLLSECKTLDLAHKLVVDNNKYYKMQLKRTENNQILFLFPPESIQKCKLKPEECLDSLQYLPKEHRPILLTDIVREKINLENIVDKDGNVANELEFFLHGRYFVTGFLRLIRHAYKNKNVWNAEEEMRLAKMLENITCRHVSGIRTYLVVKSQNEGQVCTESPVGEPEESKSIHLEINENKVCVFFDTTNAKWFHTVSRQLTVYLNGLVCKCLKDECLMILMEMIGMKDSPEGIDIHLSKEKIEEYQTTIEIEECPTYPIPGTFVPKDLLSFLDNDYGAINEYDYKFIAFEIEDPVMMSAEDDNDEPSQDTDPVYIFIHIINRSGQVSELPLLQEYEINDGSETPRTVKAYQLYKFVRKNETAGKSRNELVVFERSGSESKLNTSTSLKAAYNEVKRYLREAWTKPEGERRKIVKRLMLKWHPDKNPDNKEFCTKVFQFIQQCLLRLDNGEDLIDEEETEKSESKNWSSSWYGRYWFRFNRRRGNSGKHNTHFNSFNEYWSFRQTSYVHVHIPEEPYPWYSEARRWMKQAESDLRNAEFSMQDTNQHSCNWICYKAHQAAEKALKAAWYAEDANKLRRLKYSHNLNSLASGLFSDIGPLARRLSDAAGDHSRMRYPDMFAGQQIPADAYTVENAQTILSMVKEVLRLVQRQHIK